MTELISACKDDDADSKKLMEELVPHLVHKLQQKKQWETPNHCLFNSRETLHVIKNEMDFHEVAIPDDVFDILVSTYLDKDSKQPDSDSENKSSPSIIHQDLESNATEAICNLISDVNPELPEITEQHSTINVNSLLRNLQPYKEKTSKDRSK